MSIHKKRIWLACALFFAAGIIFLPTPRALAEETVLVGRIAFTEGEILRYVPDTQDWVATVKDAPFGIDDALYSDEGARAEFVMPNGIWARIDGSTQIQLIGLEDDAAEMDVAAGSARFYNKGSEVMLKVTTPFGYVLAEPDSSFDIYVGDQSVEVIALGDGIDFIHQKDEARYEVVPGSGSIIADADQVGAGDGTVDASWDDWNTERDNLWAKRIQVKGDSAQYLPPQIQDNAYELEENGKWERVYYEGEYRQFWRPTRVDASWQPFTVGRWTEWYGDQCWMPDEPFGYVTHHYGNWVTVNGGWFWAPPVAAVTVVRGPLLGFGWYPGRVAWIHTAADVGWIPLAPTEIYYAHRRWGPRAVVVAGVPSVNIAIGGLAFARAAVIVPQVSFYGVRNYATVRITNINRTTIINNFRSAPIVNHTVIKNYNQINARYNFRNVDVTRKPHQVVTQRIQRNRQLAAKEARQVNARSFRQALEKTRPATATRQASMPQPRVSNKIVPANQVNKPRSEVQFQPRDLKQKTKPATVGTRGPAQMRPGVRSGQGPAQDQKPGAQGVRSPRGPAERVTPGARGAETFGERQQGEPKGPARPARPSERVRPGKTPQAGEQPEATTPARPGRTRERVQPGRTPQVGEQPGASAPARPGRAGEQVQPRGRQSGEPSAPGVRRPGATLPETREPGLQKKRAPSDQSGARRPEALDSAQSGRSGRQFQPGNQPGARGQASFDRQPRVRATERQQVPPQQTLEPRGAHRGQGQGFQQQEQPRPKGQGKAQQQQQQGQKKKPWEQ